jgi:hypothetical protein
VLLSAVVCKRCKSSFVEVPGFRNVLNNGQSKVILVQRIIHFSQRFEASVASFTSRLTEGKLTELYESISGFSFVQEIIILRIGKFIQKGICQNIDFTAPSSCQLVLYVNKVMALLTQRVTSLNTNKIYSYVSR